MMTSMEKFQKMLSLAPYNDRREIPVFPQMITSIAALAGKKQVECFGNDKIANYQEAILKVCEVVGKPDVVWPTNPEEAVFQMGLPSRVPGRELGEDSCYQFIEKPYFDDPEEYKKRFFRDSESPQNFFMFRLGLRQDRGMLTKHAPEATRGRNHKDFSLDGAGACLRPSRNMLEIRGPSPLERKKRRHSGGKDAPALWASPSHQILTFL